MITFPAKARTGADGTLSLAIPTGLPDAEVDVVVVVEAAGRDMAMPSDEWPEGYFARHFGSLRDAGLERPPQATGLCAAVTEEGALVVEAREQGLRRARALLRKYIPEGVNLSDELIAERRAEAARESEQPQ